MTSDCKAERKILFRGSLCAYLSASACKYRILRDWTHLPSLLLDFRDHIASIIRSAANPIFAFFPKRLTPFSSGFSVKKNILARLTAPREAVIPSAGCVNVSKWILNDLDKIFTR